VGNRAFFVAHDGAWPRALYVTDGTAQGTRRIRELADSPYWEIRPAAMGDLLVFGDYTEANGHEVYVSDGTREGTRMVVDRCPGSCSGGYRAPQATSQGVFWVDYDTREILHLDPAGETIQALPAACAHDCLSESLAELGGKLLYWEREPQVSRLLLLADVGGAPQVLRTFNHAQGPLSLSPMARSGGKLFFTALDIFNQVQRFYQTDATPQGTVTVPNAPSFSHSVSLISPPPEVDVPLLLLYDFAFSDLFAYRPDTGGQVLSNDSGQPLWVGSSAEAGLAFFITDPGRLHWVDTTFHQGSVPLANSYYATFRTSAELGDGEVALRLDDGNGFEPWRFRAGQLTRIRDIAVDGERSSNPEPYAVADGYLAVLDPERPEEEPDLPAINLFKVDDGATQATPWGQGPFYAFEEGAGGLFLLRATSNFGLHFSDGTAAPTAMGADYVRYGSARQAGTAERIYFTTDEAGQDVWTSDGTAAGTREIHDPDPDYQDECNILCPPGPQSVPYWIVADATQAFWVGRGEIDYPLWRVDAAGLAPRLLATDYWQPQPLRVWRGELYYVVWVDEYPPGSGFWRLAASDGVTTRTIKELTTLEPYWSFGELVPEPLTAELGDDLYFLIDRIRYPQLWRTDGTPAGTSVVHDFGANARALEMTAGGSRVFLALATPEQGSELWIADGSAAGTARLDLRPGPFGSHPTELHALADGRVVFAADDGVNGHEPWISDGTAAGTRLLDDIGPGASSPGHWASKGSRVLFAANAGTLGRELYALDIGPALPSCPADRLCLQDGRFEVQVAFTAPDGANGLGQRALTSESSGVFTFFSPDNWELTVKVLDGCGINDRFWVFAAATTDVYYDLTVVDRATGASKTYRNPQGTLAAAVTDTGAFATCAATPPSPRYGPGGPIPQAARLCPGDASALCLGEDQRFRVRVAWETEDGVEGVGQPVPYGSADSGLFTFFSADNWELMVKVLDGCALNGQHWLFAAGTTNVGWTLTLEDRQGLLPPQTYTNPVGTAAAAIADTAAMACTP
jgi:ELWxxDGT repeat protein